MFKRQTHPPVGNSSESIAKKPQFNSKYSEKPNEYMPQDSKLSAPQSDLLDQAHIARLSPEQLSITDPHHLNVNIQYDRHHSINSDSSTSPLMTRNNSILPTSPTSTAHFNNGSNSVPDIRNDYNYSHDSAPSDTPAKVLKNYQGFHTEHYGSSHQIKSKPKKLKRRSTALLNKIIPSRRESESSQYSGLSMSPKASINSINPTSSHQQISPPSSSRIPSSLNLSRLGKKPLAPSEPDHFLGGGSTIQTSSLNRSSKSDKTSSGLEDMTTPTSTSSASTPKKEDVTVAKVDPFFLDLDTDSNEMAGIVSSVPINDQKKMSVSSSKTTKSASFTNLNAPRESWTAPESWKVKPVSGAPANPSSAANLESTRAGLTASIPTSNKGSSSHLPSLGELPPRQNSKAFTLNTNSSSVTDFNDNLDSTSVSSASSTCSSDDSNVPEKTGESNANSRMNSAGTVDSTNTSASAKGGKSRHHHHRNSTQQVSRLGPMTPIPGNFHTKELKGAARSSLRVFKGDKTSVLPCSLDTTCQNILEILRRKRFLKAEDEHILVLQCGGLIRSLSLDDKPLKIQRNLLFLYGYNERDNLEIIERTDLSFLFKFLIQDRGVELISMEKRRKINPSDVDLNNWNLQDIPNFLYAEPIVTLDVSQNPSFEFTKDFIHDCRNLKNLLFTKSSVAKFPISIVHAPKLAKLDLGVNNIKLIPPEISMLRTLTKLSLNCNRISYLPDSFGELENLQYLNLDSNRLKFIPDCIFKLTNLVDLDLSYNAVSEIPPEIANLKKLENLKLSANLLSRDLPDSFKELKALTKIDLRFNNLSKIDSLKDLPELMIIRATGNNISTFSSNALNLGELELNMNPITTIEFSNQMINLKFIDLSKAKLSSCAFFSKLPAIEKLSLDNNHLVSLPDSTATMKNLTYLSVYKNNLMSIPTTIGNLTKLKYLDLHLNNISELNPIIWSLESLEYLNLSSNLLENFPEPPMNLLPGLRKMDTIKTQGTTKTNESSIAETAMISSPPLQPMKRRGSEAVSPMNNNKEYSYNIETSLKTLCLADNKLNDGVIQTISLFTGLESLNLSYNELFEISSGYLSNLRNLKSLFLSGNHLVSLPVEDFDSFSHMTALHINGNRFHALPAELSKITNLTALDVGSNNLKYNIGNIPYDWNWCYNPKLNYLNFSGNKRLEIKPQHKREGMDEPLDSFLVLKDLKMLGLMDVTITTDAVPDQTTETRVRSTVSQLGKFGYGISDSFGENKVLTTRDVVIEKFRNNADEMLITIYDGKNCSTTSGDKISKIIQETFEIHFTKELESVGTKLEGHPRKTIEDALRGAFLTMNSEMSILINKDEFSTFSSAAAHRTTTTDELTLNEEGDKGCCATIVYIKGDEMYVANTGDIMGIMTKSNGEYSVLTTKHEPYAPEEYERIRESGGFVTTDGNLDGVTDVSRAVGFFKLIPHINAAPSISKFKLSRSDEMVAIATSEVWKQVPYDLAADILRQEKSNPGVAAEKLRDFAISYGSQDKITAVVLSLRQFSSKQKTHERGSLPEDSGLRKLDEEIEPPTGELAMVFTDIKNSTLLWDTYSSGMRAAIKVHNGIMRRQLRIIGGYEVKTEGDAFMVSFPTVISALLWCFVVQAQLLSTTEWPAEILSSEQGCEIKDENNTVIFRGLSVRMGIHWGRPVCERDIVTRRMDYFGPMVNKASRISTVADGGQITLSSDFYSEVQRIVELHKEVKAGKKSVSEAYGSKAAGQLLETQIEQLEQIGWVEQMIGAKKLKGLETPEKIWLFLPKPLSSRLKLVNSVDGKIVNKTGKLQASGINSRTLSRLRKLSLSLEAICSYLSGTRSGSFDKKMDFHSSSKEVEHLVYTEFKERELLLFLDHLITRIENCVTMLSMRQMVTRVSQGSQNNMDIVSASDVIAQLSSMLGELTGISLAYPQNNMAAESRSMEAVEEIRSLEEVRSIEQAPTAPTSPVAQSTAQLAKF